MNIIKVLAEKELLVNYKQKRHISAAKVAQLYMQYDKQIEEYAADAHTIKNDEHWIAMAYYYMVRGNGLGQNKKIDSQLAIISDKSGIKNLCQAIIEDANGHKETAALKLIYAKRGFAKKGGAVVNYLTDILDMSSPRKTNVEKLPELSKEEVEELKPSDRFIYAKYLQLSGNIKESKKQFETLASGRTYNKSNYSYEHDYYFSRQ